MYVQKVTYRRRVIENKQAVGCTVEISPSREENNLRSVSFGGRRGVQFLLPPPDRRYWSVHSEDQLKGGATDPGCESELSIKAFYRTATKYAHFDLKRDNASRESRLYNCVRR